MPVDKTCWLRMSAVRERLMLYSVISQHWQLVRGAHGDVSIAYEAIRVCDS